MAKKTAIRYLRISTERQSNFSIDGQEMSTKSWCERNDVVIVDTFIDEGYSARNFDRPDFQRLTRFIAQHYRTVDFLVVNSFDRFSREAGEAIVHIKKLQKQFAIKVVSVSEGVTFDADDPGSFFYAGLMLLKGEDEIIRNRSRINLGIYTAKKKEGRYLGAAPYGYKNTKDENNKPIIIPDESRAYIIKYIFNAYLENTPIGDITREARKMGLNLQGNTAIRTILQRHAYAGLLHVKAYKEYPEEIVEAIHEPLVSKEVWYQVQKKLRGKEKIRTIINDDLPLRAVLKCHCGTPLTGAASTGKGGKHFLYYKCNQQSGHNNISAIKAHQQLLSVWEYMSLPDYLIAVTKQKNQQMLEEHFSTNIKLLRNKKNEYNKAQEELESIEQKWISNQMSFETYQRWYSRLTDQRIALKAQIAKLGQDQNETWLLLQDELEKLSDLKYLYNQAQTVEKQNMLKLVFDNSLYYQNKIYRTPYIMEIFTSNTLILKEKGLLIYECTDSKISNPPSGGAGGSRTRVQTSLP